MGFSTSLIVFRRHDGCDVDVGALLAGRIHLGVVVDLAPWFVFRHRDSSSYPAAIFQLDESATAAFSVDGECLCMVGHSNVDQFAYERSVDGVVVRKLIAFGDGEPWEARGTPDPWESAFGDVVIEHGATEPAASGELPIIVLRRLGIAIDLMTKP
jgi:hypothetical protein